MTDPLSQIAAAAENAPEAPDMRPANTEGADRRHLDNFILPPDCPVAPLGHLKKVLYVLDVDGQLLELAPKLPKEDIVYIFGDAIGWLEEQDALAAWKAVGKQKGTDIVLYEKNGFDQRKVQEAFVRACRRKGFLDIANKVRGRGSHLGTDGELILHCGDEILIGGRVGVRGQAKKSAWEKPGMIGPLIFPTGPALPHPAKDAAKVEVGDALIDMLCLWIWQGTAKVEVKGKTIPIEALLMLGWLGCAKLCGAIGWRPHIWLIGPSGSGKSTLQALIRRVLDEWALESQDPSEAWISQSLMDQRLSVLYDEPEPDETEGGGFVRKVIKLARLASQGGKRGRGSQDHKAVDFASFSCFLFSSIMHHELEAQDRNRIAILSLAKFPPETAAMDINGLERLLKPRWKLPGTIRDMGQGLTRRLVEHWPRYRHTLGVYQAALLEARADPRAQNTYGEILTLADMILYDDAPELMPDVGDPNPVDDRHRRARRMVAALVPILDTAAAESENVGERCLGRLTQYRLTAAGGMHQETVGRWIEKALVALVLRDNLGRFGARDKLITHGLRLVHATKVGGAIDAYADPADEPVYLAVANKNHEALKQIFAGTNWKNGEWMQALGPPHIEGSIRKTAKVRYGGPGQWSRLVPIGEVADMNAVRGEAERIRSQDLAS